MVPDDRLYTRAHMWVRTTPALTEVGVTEPLLSRVVPLISLELPDADDDMQTDLAFGEVEGLNEARQFYRDRGTISEGEWTTYMQTLESGVREGDHA